jgi:hypothetical protein
MRGGRGIVIEMVRGGCEMDEGAGRKREEESMGFVVRGGERLANWVYGVGCIGVRSRYRVGRRYLND